MNEFILDLNCCILFVELFEFSLSDCWLVFDVESQWRKKPKSLLVTIGLVHGDCKGVVWQLWCLGLKKFW